MKTRKYSTYRYFKPALRRALAEYGNLKIIWFFEDHHWYLKTPKEQ